MATEEQNKLLEELQVTWKALQERIDTESKEVKAFGSASVETKNAIKAINERMDSIETKLARPQLVIKEAEKAKEVPVENRAFEKYLRYGMKHAADRMTDEEKSAFASFRTKALSESDDTQGGFLVPEDFRTEVIRKLPNLAGVSALVTRQPTSRDILRYPFVNYTTDDINTSGLAVTWEDENDTATATDFALGSVAVPVKKARALIKVSNDLLEDSAVNVLDLLTSLIAERFAVEEDLQVTKGDGGKKPQGFMTNPDIGYIPGTDASALVYDGVVDLTYGLPEQYAQNAIFMCRRSSMGALRKIKDTTNQPIWQPGMSAGQPATLMGYPIRSNEHMPAIAANAYPLIFADFRQLYLIAERVGMTVRRLDEVYAATDEVGFVVRRRLGGRVKAHWAAKKLKVATS